MDSVKKQHVTKPILTNIEIGEEILAIETWINREYEENVIVIRKQIENCGVLVEEFELEIFYVQPVQIWKPFGIGEEVEGGFGELEENWGWVGEDENHTWRWACRALEFGEIEIIT